MYRITQDSPWAPQGMARNGPICRECGTATSLLFDYNEAIYKIQICFKDKKQFPFLYVHWSPLKMSYPLFSNM